MTSPPFRLLVPKKNLGIILDSVFPFILHINSFTKSVGSTYKASRIDHFSITPLPPSDAGHHHSPRWVIEIDFCSLLHLV
jgi:hypothetical protein